MKPIRWTTHAQVKTANREIERVEAEMAVRQPDATAPAGPQRQFHQRRYFDPTLQAEMLLRVLVEETDAELVVVTLYKTSKFKKYEGGQSE
jgi:hypothetical protein